MNFECFSRFANFRAFKSQAAFVVLCLPLLGCSSGTDSTPDIEDSEQEMTANDSVKDQLQFASTDDSQRFQCIYDQFALVSKDEGLSEMDMMHFENDKLVSKLWCDGRGMKDSVSCQNPLFSGPLKGAGSQFRSLQTFVDDQFPNVMGTVEAFGHNPEDSSAWGIKFRRTMNATTGVSGNERGSNFLAIGFTKIDDTGEYATALQFDVSLGYRFDGTNVQVTFESDIFDDFEQLSSSPELFATTLEARYNTLQAEIERQLASGGLTDSTGDASAQVTQYMDSKRQLIRSNAAELHGLLKNNVDTSRCQ